MAVARTRVLHAHRGPKWDNKILPTVAILWVGRSALKICCYTMGTDPLIAARAKIGLSHSGGAAAQETAVAIRATGRAMSDQKSDNPILAESNSPRATACLAHSHR